MSQPKINLETCIGCGTCEALCPEVFKLKEDMKAYVIEGVNYEDYQEKIQQAVESCPTQAITV